jgi:FAD/FMN-containing dehydrogenase
MNFELGAESQEELNTIRNRIMGVLQKYQKEYGEQKLFEWKLDAKNIGARLTKPNRISVPYAGHKGGGLLFITWYVPWKESAEFGKEAEKLMEKYKFSPVVWLAAVDHGRQGLIMPIVLFDPKTQEEFDTVNTLDAEMTDRFLKMGGIPYRPNADIHAPRIMKQSIGYYDFLKKLKQTLDPNGIMHPGRLALLTEE